MTDQINKPPHYTKAKIECWDAIECAVQELDGIEAHLTGCCIKYLWRWKNKNGVEDLHKCQAYLKRLIDIALESNAQTIGADYEVNP